MLENLTAVNLILLGVAMFASGFIDAIAGGGGLIHGPRGCAMAALDASLLCSSLATHREIHERPPTGPMLDPVADGRSARA